MSEIEDKFANATCNVLEYDEKEMTVARFLSDCIFWFCKKKDPFNLTWFRGERWKRHKPNMQSKYKKKDMLHLVCVLQKKFKKYWVLDLVLGFYSIPAGLIWFFIPQEKVKFSFLPPAKKQGRPLR